MLRSCICFCCLVLCLQFYFSSLYAQKSHVKTDYFDRNNIPSQKDSALYKWVYYKYDDYWEIDNYKRDSLNTAFYLREEKLIPDTSKKNNWYKYTFFYKNGKKEEYRHSEDSITAYAEHYSEKGKKDGAAIWIKNKMTTSKGWDTKGRLIPNFIYERDAEFPTGPKGWKNHILKTIHPEVPSENGAPSGGNYTVFVRFIIDKEGNVNMVEAENDPGYGTKEEAERVVKASVKWKPAIIMNNKVTFRQRQQITFQEALEDEPKVGETRFNFLDQNFQVTDSASAIFRSEEKIIDDSTTEIKTYLISTSLLILDSKGVRSFDGKQYSYYKKYTLKGNLEFEVETIDAKIKKTTKYHPNGVKAEEIIYGDIDLPMKSTCWDKNGKIIP